MSVSFRPLLIYPCVIRKNQTIFRLPSASVEVTIPSVLAEKLVILADGAQTAEQLLKNLGNQWSTRSLRRLIESLKAQGILLDGRNVSPALWEFVRNPSPIAHGLDEEEVMNLVRDTSLQQSDQAITHTLRVSSPSPALAARSSERLFGSQPVSATSLGTILWSAYGMLKSSNMCKEERIPRRTVPSAGGLYPIVLHLVLFKRAGRVAPGIYRVTSTRPEKVELHKQNSDPELCRSSFVDRSTTRSASGVLVISGSIVRSTMKYANRGVLYTILEAGHVAQNALLAIQEEALFAVEIGGFFEKRIQETLNLSADCEPLTTVVFGTPPSTDEPQMAHFSNNGSELISHLELAPQRVKGYRTPFRMVFAEVNDGGDPWWSCGRLKDLRLAKTKAVAEAIEWHACGNVNHEALMRASFTEIRDIAIDPRSMAKYIPGQFKKTELRPFNCKELYAWQEVKNLHTGEKRSVLADFIFFPYTPQNRKRYAFANSSGCAAHTTREQAVKNALLELIEREAFMVTWLNQLVRPRIATNSLPGNIQRRLQALKAVGFNTSIVDLTYGLTPVPFIISTSTDHSFVTCSAASAFVAEEALDKALMEVEASVYCHLKDGSALSSISPEHVRGPEDHALLYEETRHVRRTTFLHGDPRKGLKFREFSQGSSLKSVDELAETLKQAHLVIYVHEFTASSPSVDDEMYKVVRVLVPGMVPMTFGFDLAPLALTRIQSLPMVHGQKAKAPERLNRFPHPFN